MTDTAKLARMANQIATFFGSQPDVDPATATAQHLREFWSPAMRTDLAVLMAEGGGALSPVAQEAARKLAG